MAGPVGKGLASQFLPSIMKGLLVEYLGKVDISVIIDYVEKDTRLLSLMPEQSIERAKATINDLTKGNISWFTSEWTINAIRKDLPKVASLFLGWDKARNWLDRQVKDIKITLTE